LAVDPITECELALRMGMSLAELRHGRGTPMPLSELTVEWPLYEAYLNRQGARDRADEARRAKRIV
jgi:hypothetical protein